MQAQELIMYGWQLALIGMLAVFGFLWLVVLCVDATSYIVRLTEKKETNTDKVAAAIVVALYQGGK